MEEISDNKRPPPSSESFIKLTKINNSRRRSRRNRRQAYRGTELSVDSDDEDEDVHGNGEQDLEMILQESISTNLSEFSPPIAQQEKYIHRYKTITQNKTEIEPENKSFIPLHLKLHKHKISQYSIVRSFILLHILQQMASFYYYYRLHSNQLAPQQLGSYSITSSPSFALVDALRANKEQVTETDRINKLLTQEFTVNEATIKPLDFVKHHVDNQHFKQQHNQNHQNAHRHHHRKRHNHHMNGIERNRRHNNNNNNNDGYFDAASSAADRPVVATRKGLIRGITQKIVTGNYVDAFLGIPFAQPPIGRYRFRHPQPVNPWQGELDASRLSSSCYQVNDTFFGANFKGTTVWNANTPLDEDCLYLNIWTPFGVANTTVPSVMSKNQVHKINKPTSTSDQAKSSKESKRPVLVWIFGGGFYSGTSSLALYEGGALASEEDIIVVSMNYRVSALGFLYFGRPDAPGNAGLFDQLLALQWINDNIGQFGGDPERVTIFGESAGAVSISYHLLSPLSRNLFSQAILQSGAATCPWGLMDSREIIANGLQLASLINCPSNQSDLDAVVECLLKADPLALVSQEVGQTRSILNFPFVPVVDGSFLIEPPAESLAKANFKQARVLLGSNYDEGNAFLIYLPEFSHCPSSSGPGQTSPPPLPSTSPADIDSGPSSHQQNDVDNPMMLMSESRDQPSSDQIESLGLVAGSGRQSSSHSQQQHQQQQLTNQQQDQNDSKPCKPIEYLSLSRDDFFNVLREELNPYAEHPIGKDAIVFEYSNWNNPQDPVSNYDAVDKIVGDYYFTCHVNEFAQQYAQAGNAVYMYYFKQRSSRSPWPKWMGVLHGDEINFVFGEPLNQMYNYTPKEVELSKRMMKYWGNFAKFG